jgi:hypothetical protein
MGSSTVTLQSVIDNVAAQGAPSPLAQPSGYSTQLALDIATDVMSDLINERFNWKWNRQSAAPIYTNSWQQDYPQIGNTTIAWLEYADRVDINNSSQPLPLHQITARKDLPRTSFSRGPVSEVSWRYNRDLVFGRWPGAHMQYVPLVGNNPMVQQNPYMSMIDSNGNMLIVTGFGTTGSTAPVLPLNSPEGTTVLDGTVTWTCVAPNSKGFRIFPLPGGTGPVYQITPVFQALPVTFKSIDQLLDPIPDDQAKHFRRGYRAYCFDASPNPADKQRFQPAYAEWMSTLLAIRREADKELNVYGLVPATGVVEQIYPGLRDPRDPSQPY